MPATFAPQWRQGRHLPAVTGMDIKASGPVLIWCKVANATIAWAPLK
jgi:hypothetical protein